MIAARIKDFTRWLGPPPSWKDEGKQCSSLAIKDVETTHGPFMESAWEPTPEDRLAIAAGAHIIPGICGMVHPPIYLGTSEAPERFSNAPPSAEECMAIVESLRRLMNDAGAAITRPEEILHAVRVLTLNAEVRAILGARPK